MKKTGTTKRKQEILGLWEKGLSQRAIAKKLGIKAHSVIAHYLRKSNPYKRVTLNVLEELLPKKRYPIHARNFLEAESNAITAGWNEYRSEMLKIIATLAKK